MALVPAPLSESRKVSRGELTVLFRGFVENRPHLLGGRGFFEGKSPNSDVSFERSFCEISEGVDFESPDERRCAFYDVVS